MIKNRKYFLISIFFFSLLLKLTYGFFFCERFHSANFDIGPYETMAFNYSSGNGLTYEMKVNDELTVIRYNEDELAYPLLCGIVYFLSRHNIILMLFIQMFYASLIPVFIYYICEMLFTQTVARLSAFLSAFAPGIIVYSACKIHSMPFYALVFCIALFSVLKFIKRQNNFNAFFLGAMLGLGVLSRNNFILFVFLLPIYLIFKRCLTFYYFKRIFIAFLLVLAPLAIRNYVIYKKIVILKPAVIWPAMNPKASGSLYNADGSASFSDVNRALFSKTRSLGDLEYSQIINKAVGDNIKENMAGYLKLCLKRFFYFWWFSPDTGKIYPKFFLFAYLPYYLLLLTFAICGIIKLSIKTFTNKLALSEENWLILPIFVVSITLAHYFYYAEGRHRFAIEPLLLIFSGYGLVYFWGLIPRRNLPRLKPREMNGIVLFLLGMNLRT